jgi:hypothetical protein
METKNKIKDTEFDNILRDWVLDGIKKVQKLNRRRVINKTKKCEHNAKYH